ncbi:hypothetical protein RCL1_001741 [Eukaryota sp. TZLM3-RCL]
MYHYSDASAPPLASHSVNPVESSFERFKHLVAKYEISDKMAMYLRELENFDIVIIADDSGSMSTPLAPVSALSQPMTRWAELKQQISIISEIATCLDDDGIDLYFLNRNGKSNVTNPSELDPFFAVPPAGCTPIVDCMRRVMNDKKSVLNNAERSKKLLLIIVTDGQPTTRTGQLDISSFERELRNRPENVYTTIVACTDDDSCMNYLNNLDNSVKNLDVVDDYVNERKEVREHMGSDFSFSYGDYIVKILCGSFTPELDNLDGGAGKACCTIL